MYTTLEQFKENYDGYLLMSMKIPAYSEWIENTGHDKDEFPYLISYMGVQYKLRTTYIDMFKNNENEVVVFKYFANDKTIWLPYLKKDQEERLKKYKELEKEK